MILVLGNITASPARFPEALALSQAHVRRARGVPGCISHAVHIDSDDPLRLVFIERWADQDNIWAHVNSPETRAFVKALAGCVVSATPTEFFEAHPIQRPPRKAAVAP